MAVPDKMAFRERRLRLVRLTVVLAAAGAITALASVLSLFEEFGVGWLVALACGLAALAAGSLAARRLQRTVQYRIDRPNATVWLTVKIAVLVAALAGAVAIATVLDAPALPRTVIVVVVVGALAGVVNAHTARWTLLRIDATGLKVGQATVPWTSAAQLDVAPAAPGTAEIGVHLVPGQVVNGTPVPGTVLADVPVCTTIPAAAVDVDRIRWAVHEFGNPALPVVTRDTTAASHALGHSEFRFRAPDTPPPGVLPAAPPYAGPLPPPAPSRKGWLIGGALGLVAVLAAGAVTAVVLLDDESGKPTGADHRPTYGADGAGNLCHLVDVGVLASWSTEKDVLDESGESTKPGYESFHCDARTGGEGAPGRVAQLTMSAVVAADAGTAREFLREAKEEDRWGIAGNEEEKGTVDGLGETAEYEQATSAFDGRMINEYVLAVRDDNLVLVTGLRAESDGTDGDAPDVGTLASTARAVATGVMTGLGATEPAAKDPAKAAATAPGTEELMARIRAVDPCALHRHASALLRTYGQVVPASQAEMPLYDCKVLIVADGRDPGAELRLGLDAFLSEADRAGMTREVAGEYEVYHDRPGEDATSCSSFVPYDDSGFGAKVSVERLGDHADLAPCEVAALYTRQLAGLIVSLPARTEPAAEPSLEGDDPCAADAVAREMRGWEASPVARYRATHCRFTVSRDGEHYEFDMAFERGGPPSGDERVWVATIAGKRTRSDDGKMCGVSLSYLPSATGKDGQNIAVYVRQTGSEPTQDVCDLAETTVEKVLEGR